MARAEQEILDARRAFPEAQAIFEGGTLSRLDGLVAVGWHDTSASPEAGAFAVVRRDGPYLDLVGELLRVTVDLRSVFVYCVGRADVPADLSLARRAFLALGLLTHDALDCVVEVVA